MLGCFNPNVWLKCNLKIFNYIFNPTFGFVHIWPKFGLKQPSIFVSVQMKQMKWKSYWIQILELIDWLIDFLFVFIYESGGLPLQYFLFCTADDTIYLQLHYMRIYEKWFVIHMEPIISLDLDL